MKAYSMFIVCLLQKGELGKGFGIQYIHGWLVAGDSEEASLERALAMSVEQETPSPHNRAVDFSQMTEEEQIAFAMQMSLQDSRELHFLQIMF